jgi:hypothetical protein
LLLLFSAVGFLAKLAPSSVVKATAALGAFLSVDWVLRRVRLIVGGLFGAGLELACRAGRALRDFPRRFLSRTIYNDMIGFPDSHLALGEEEEQPNEEALTKAILVILRRRHLRDFPPGVRPMLRDFHGKAHGTVSAEFILESDIPAEARFGCFAAPGGTRFEAVVRFSNASRVAGSDRQQNQRGMAIKVLVPDGERVDHQDFLLSDFPVNFMADVSDAFHFYRAEAADRPLAFFLRNLGNFALTLLASQFEKPKDVFDLKYFSQTPYKLGPGACKYIAKPTAVAPRIEWRILRTLWARVWDLPPPRPAHPLPFPPDLEDDPNFLRERMDARLAFAEVSFDLFVQPQRHPVRQPIEDASFEWREDEAVPIKVGTLRLLPKSSPSVLSRSSRWHSELLAFDPENAHRDLRPVGGLNRVRRQVYREFAAMRFGANNVAELLGDKARLPVPPASPSKPA